MPRRKIPAYRRHKASGQAVVTLNGRDFYLGRWQSRISRIEYDRLVCEWLAADRRIPERSSGLCVVELIAAYWKFARSYYVKNGGPSGSIPGIRVALRWVRATYGHTPAAEFGPLALKALQARLIDSGKSRRYINDTIDRIRRMFRWGVAEELIPAHSYEALRAVASLKKGRTAARETEPIRPIDDEIIERTLPSLPPVVAAMVRLERLTGARPQDICSLRPRDVERSGEVWIYRPAEHKTEHFGHERVVFIGPKAQRVLAAYLDRPADQYCFVPAQSERQRNVARRLARQSPMTPSQASRRRKRNPSRPPGDRYTTESYRRAVARACRKAGIEPWSPNRLRHTAGTDVRHRYGLEAAQVVLGHTNAAVSQIYAERDFGLARRVMLELG